MREAARGPKKPARLSLSCKSNEEAQHYTVIFGNESVAAEEGQGK
jgi:hypothetical protein